MVKNIPGDEEILMKVDDTFAGLDLQRADGLEDLKTLQKVKEGAGQREKDRLTRKYGADHPRVIKVADRLDYNQGLQKELVLEIERTKIILPEFDVNTWIVHGGVVDSEGTPLSGLTVSLYDEDGEWIRALGFACTDERGYFAIRNNVKSLESVEVPDMPKLILTVTDGDGKILHQETEPLYLKPGQIDYRLMVIKDKGDICPPPCPDDGGEPTREAWVVTGKVVDPKEQPLEGVTVSLYDKEMVFADLLGKTLTDANGEFKMIYGPEAHREIFIKKPAIYIDMLDKLGKVIYRSKEALVPVAGREEKLSVMIKDKTVDDAQR